MLSYGFVKKRCFKEPPAHLYLSNVFIDHQRGKITQQDSIELILVLFTPLFVSDLSHQTFTSQFKLQ